MIAPSTFVDATLFSCGYYCDPKMNQAYRNQWMDSLKGRAGTIGHAVYASLGKAERNALMGSDPYNGNHDQIPFFGVTPGGTPLPFSGPKGATGKPLS
jgi:hypothetical protein